MKRVTLQTSVHSYQWWLTKYGFKISFLYKWTFNYWSVTMLLFQESTLIILTWNVFFKNVTSHHGKGYLYMLFCAWFYAHQRKWKWSNVFPEYRPHLDQQGPWAFPFWGPRVFCLHGNPFCFSSPSVDSGDAV